MRFVVVTLAVLVSTSCAGRFQGELAGDAVPTFATAAFALTELAAPRMLVEGIAVPGDSCAEATTLSTLTAAFNETQGANLRRQRSEAIADWYNRVLPADQWLVALTMQADSKLVMQDATIPLDSGDTDIFVGLNLCKSGGKAHADNGFLEVDLDCFQATDGALKIDLSDDEQGLRLLADDDEITFSQDGRERGALRLDLSMTSCQGLSLSQTSGGGGGGECFEECRATPDGQRFCEVFCPGDSVSPSVSPDEPSDRGGGT